MRARISDPHGPKAWRVVPYVLPVLAFLFAIFGPIRGVAAATTAMSAVALFNILGLVSWRQRQPRTAELVCGAGYIDVTKAGSRNQRIRAADITGGTTARTSTGIALSLQHRTREQPITLEVETEADIEKIRLALGIGHGGFGVVAWQTQVDGTQRSALVGRALAAAWATLTVLATLGGSPALGVGIGISLGLFGVVAALLGFAGLMSPLGQPGVVMAADGLRLRTPQGWFALPYGAIQGVQDGELLYFTVPDPYKGVAVQRSSPLVGGPSEEDRRVLVAQIRAAAQRAQGFGPHKDDVSGRVDVLRRHGESARDWLVRLDMAGQMLSSGAGYRGNTLDLQDLWAILEDPEADAELRAAAARVLRHSPGPDARVRIDAAVAAVRDESTSQRLRIAIRDDLDGASQELAYLDAVEAQSRARMASHPREPHHGAGRSMHGR